MLREFRVDPKVAQCWKLGVAVFARIPSGHFLTFARGMNTLELEHFFLSGTFKFFVAVQIEPPKYERCGKDLIRAGYPPAESPGVAGPSRE